MTLFGRALSAEEIGGLVFMIAALALWIFALRGEAGWKRWLDRSPDGDKIKRAAGVRVKERAPPPEPGPRDPTRPWG